MNEQNTGSDFGEKFESQLQTETLSRLTGIGLNEEDAKAILIQESNDKLADLKSDLLSEIAKTADSQEKAEAAIAQVDIILAEHRKRLSDYMQAERQSLSMQIEESKISEKGISESLVTSVRTTLTFGKDFGIGIIEAVKNPKAAIKYVFTKADEKLSDADLNYKITT